jgi:hypothetical protein
VSPAVEALLVDLREQLDNTYLDPYIRVWMTHVVTVLEDEECKTNQPQPKSDSGPETTTSPLADEDTFRSTSSKGSTKSTRTGPSVTATPSEG